MYMSKYKANDVAEAGYPQQCLRHTCLPYALLFFNVTCRNLMIDILRFEISRATTSTSLIYNTIQHERPVNTAAPGPVSRNSTSLFVK